MAGGPLAGLLKDLEADCFASSEQRVLAAFVVGWGVGVLYGAGWHDQMVAVPHAMQSPMWQGAHVSVCLVRSAGDQM